MKRLTKLSDFIESIPWLCEPTEGNILVDNLKKKKSNSSISFWKGVDQEENRTQEIFR